MKRLQVIALALLVACAALSVSAPHVYADEAASQASEGTQDLPEDDPDPDPEPEPTTGWYEEDGKVHYILEDGSFATGWLALEGEWYWFDAEGVRFSDGWNNTIDGTWYYFGEDGKRYHDRFFEYGGETYHFGEDGVIGTGWQIIDGTWYYSESNGKLYHDRWLNHNGSWYRFDSDCSMYADAFVRVGTATYRFADSGAMATGWLSLDGIWYYAANTGELFSDRWLNHKGKWYYFDADCEMLSGVFFVYKDARYRCQASGAMATGWFSVDGDWYYAGSDGKLLRKQWLNTGNKWYYFDADYHMVSNDHIVQNGAVYLFGEQGDLRFGWIESGKTWLYAGADGKLYRNRSIVYGGKTYLFGPDCKLITDGNWTLKNGNWYYRNANGTYATGWKQIAGEWHYFKSDGSAFTGWVKLSGKWYYHDDNGRRAHDEWVTTAGKRYHVGGDGNPQTGWQWIDGGYCFFDSEGVLVTDGWALYGNTYYRMDSTGRTDYSVFTLEAIKRSVTTPEGTVQGYLLVPKGLATAPLVIFSHGLGGTGNSLWEDALELAGSGVACYVFDYIGGSISSASGGSMLSMSVDTEVSQLNAIVENALAWSGIDADRVILAGHSQGGLVSTLVASSRTDIAGLILLSPALNLGDLLRSRIGSLSSIGSTFTFLSITLGHVYAEALWGVYESGVCEGYDGPALIVHGQKDQIVAYSVSTRAKQSWGNACTLVTLPDADHFSVLDRDEAVINHMIHFVRTH